MSDMTDPTNDNKFLPLFAHLEQGNELEAIRQGYFSLDTCQELATRFDVPFKLIWRAFTSFYVRYS